MSIFPWKTPIIRRIVATAPDQTKAEQAVRLLHEEGFPLDILAIEGHNVEETVEPVGLLSRGFYVQAAALVGACGGALVGMSLGAAFLVHPKSGLVEAEEPLWATILASIVGAAAGALLGSLAGALLEWIVPRRRGIKYDIQVTSGRFFIVVRSTAGVVARARSLLASKGPELIEVYDQQRHQQRHSGNGLPRTNGKLAR
jgi:hypothetical protein